MPLTQNRRRTRERNESDDENDRPRQRRQAANSDEEPENDSQDDMDMDEPAAQSADDILAKKLVRYAISCEYSRTIIRRDGIKERVLGNQGRAFKRVFALAQKQLKEVWGMELRELPVREKMGLHEKRKAMSSNSQPKTGSATYILTSTLPDRYRSAAILPPSKTPGPDDEATYAAFYSLVVSVIWLNGGELTEQKLRRYLSRLNADQNVATDKTEDTMKKLERQGYVIKRTERPPVGHDGEHVITWHIGPRAKEEIGLDGVMGMVQEVYGGSTPELDKKIRASLGIKGRLGASETETATEQAEGGEANENGAEEAEEA